MTEIWAAVVGVAGTGLLGLIAAVVMGKLVPSSRVDDARREVEARLADAEAARDKAEKEADTWHASHDSIKAAFDGQTKILERQQLTADITDKAMAAVREMLAGTGGATP